jgi:hypothetical protein
MSTTCWCEGRNENCAWCSGSGVRAERVGTPPRARKRSRKDFRKGAAPTANAVRATTTNAVGVEPQLTSDVVAPSQFIQPLPEARGRPTGRKGIRSKKRDRQPKPQPRNRAADRRIKSPVRPMVSATRPDDFPTVLLPGTRRPRTGSLVYCPTCSAAVRADRLERHQRRVHGRAGRKIPAVTRTQKTRPRPNERRPGKIDSAPAASAHERNAHEERRLDGARHHWATYRDYGSFGSHATYDDYGEESEM